MTTTSKQNPWAFGLGWIIANGFAWGVYYLIDILVRFAGGLTSSTFMFKFFPLAKIDLFTGAWIGAVTCGLIWGTLVGALQRLALRRRLVRRGRWWILATLIGLIPLAVYLYLYQILTSDVGFPEATLNHLNQLFTVMEFLAPVWFGFFQWLVLRRTVRRAAWWILAVALVVGLVTVSFPVPTLALEIFRPHPAYLLLAPGILGLVYALVTWVVLSLLPLRRPW